MLLLPQGKALLIWVKALVEEISEMVNCENNFNCDYRLAIGSDRCSISVSPSLGKEQTTYLFFEQEE